MGTTSLTAENLRQGDPAALDELLRDLAPLLRLIVRRIAPSEMDAEDVVTEVFLRLLRDRDKLAGLFEKGRIKTYCLSLARNIAISRMHHAMRSASIEELRVEVPTPDAVATHEARDALVQLERAIAGLPTGDQALLHRLYAEGGAVEETAEELGISVNTLRLRRARLLKQLRSLLREGA